MATHKLTKSRTHVSKSSSEHDSSSSHNGSKSDIPSTPMSKDSRGRSNSILSLKRQPLRELSPSERNEKSVPEHDDQMPPFIRIESEGGASESRERESSPPGIQRAAPSATYSQSPFPSDPSHILQPRGKLPVFSFPNRETSADLDSSVGSSDAPEFFSRPYPEPAPAEAKRQSMGTIRSVTDRERSVASPAPSGMSANSDESKLLASTIRSIQPSEELKSSPASGRSSASSYIRATPGHEDRRSTGSNWTTFHAPNSTSTRPSSTETHARSSLGFKSPLFGSRSPGSPSSRRPLSTIGNPLSPYLDSEFEESRPLSTYSSRDQLLNDSRSPSALSNAHKAVLATENLEVHNPEVRSVSVGSHASTDEERPPSITMPTRAARSSAWSAHLSPIASQSEPLSRLPTIPSSAHSARTTERWSQGEQHIRDDSMVSLPTMRIESSMSYSPEQRRYTRDDAGGESSTTAARRAGIPPIRNPWQSVDSMSFFFGGEESRPPTRLGSKGSNSSNNTVVHMGRGLPAWARSFYSNRSPSALSLNAASDPSTDAPSSSSRRPTTDETAPSRSPKSSDFSIASLYRPRNRPRSALYSQAWSSTDSDSTTAAAAAAATAEIEQALGANTPLTLTMSQIPTTADGSYFTNGRSAPGHDDSHPRLRRERLGSAQCFRPVSWLVGPGAGRASLWQIGLFCLGFVVPLAWLLAAFLPVPAGWDDEEKRRAEGGGGGWQAARAEKEKEKERVATAAAAGGADVERAEQGSLLERERARAKWWRSVNRKMSLVGCTVIIIAVAISVTLAP